MATHGFLFLSSSPSSPLRSLLPLSQVLFRRRRPIASSLAKHPGKCSKTSGRGCGTVALSRHCGLKMCDGFRHLGFTARLCGLWRKKGKEKAVSIVFLLLLSSDLSDASCAVYRRVLKHECLFRNSFPSDLSQSVFCVCRKGVYS